MRVARILVPLILGVVLGVCARAAAQVPAVAGDNGGGAVVFVDPFDGIRKVRVPVEQVRTNVGIQWALTANGRVVAYDSNREYANAATEERPFKIFPFVQWGSLDPPTYPANPVDPFGFLMIEIVNRQGELSAERIALTWEHYELAVKASTSMIELMLQNQTTLSFDPDDERPIATVAVPGTTYVYTITPDTARMDSAQESGESPIGLTSATVIAAANRTLGVGGGGQPGGSGISDISAAAEWFFFYDQLYLWTTFLEDQILDEDIGGESLLTLIPSELSAQLPSFYEGVLQQRDDLVAQESEENREFYATLEHRRLQREAYREWREQEKGQILRFAEEQRREITGREVFIENSVFLVTSEPLYYVPEDRVNVQSESGLITPYDILTPEGKLRTPYRVE